MGRGEIPRHRRSTLLPAANLGPSRRTQTNAKGIPRVLHADGRLESTVYAEVGNIIAPHYAWYTRSSTVNTIEQIPSGFVYSDDPNGRYQVAATLIGFRELTGIQAKGSLEKYMEPGVLTSDGNGATIFIPKSFTTDFCAGLIQSDQLKKSFRESPVCLPCHYLSRSETACFIQPRATIRRFATYLFA